MADRIPMFSVYDTQGNRIEIPAIAGRSAYKEAVAQGYQGTQEEFGLEQANFASNAAQVAADREACEAAVRDINNILVTKADPSIKVELILSASGWIGNSAPYTQTILIDGLTPE